MIEWQLNIYVSYSVQLLPSGVGGAVCFSLMSVADTAPECRGGNKGARIVTKQWLQVDTSAGLSVSANSELYSEPSDEFIR